MSTLTEEMDVSETDKVVARCNALIRRDSIAMHTRTGVFVQQIIQSYLYDLCKAAVNNVPADPSTFRGASVVIGNEYMHVDLAIANNILHEVSQQLRDVRSLRLEYCHRISSSPKPDTSCGHPRHAQCQQYYIVLKLCLSV